MQANQISELNNKFKIKPTLNNKSTTLEQNIKQFLKLKKYNQLKKSGHVMVGSYYSLNNKNFFETYRLIKAHPIMQRMTKSDNYNNNQSPCFYRFSDHEEKDVMAKNNHTVSYFWHLFPHINQSEIINLTIANIRSSDGSFYDSELKEVENILRSQKLKLFINRADQIGNLSFDSNFINFDYINQILVTSAGLSLCKEIDTSSVLAYHYLLKDKASFDPIQQSFDQLIPSLKAVVQFYKTIYKNSLQKNIEIPVEILSSEKIFDYQSYKIINPHGKIDPNSIKDLVKKTSDLVAFWEAIIKIYGQYHKSNPSSTKSYTKSWKF
jgi:hypothetical protein